MIVHLRGLSLYDMSEHKVVHILKDDKLFEDSGPDDAAIIWLDFNSKIKQPRFGHALLVVNHSSGLKIYKAYIEDDCSSTLSLLKTFNLFEIQTYFLYRTIKLITLDANYLVVGCDRCNDLYYLSISL